MGTNPVFMEWIDIEDIVESLDAKFPEVDVLRLRFTELTNMILSLQDFKGDASSCNEKILEKIQGEWINLRECE